MTTMTSIRSYSELVQLDSFQERFDYLRLEGNVGHETFGFDRHVNQSFYHSRYWEDIRRDVIIRDNGCDLGIPGYEIHHEPIVHHMNPISLDDILGREEDILNPEFLILTTHATHNDIHYGRVRSFPRVVARRSPGDTKLW